MKKLSVEEKAKRYDEAFEIARKINSGEGVEAYPDWTIPEVIFHELRENKDEKIREELLEHCINRRDGKQVCVDASDYERWADWLFRQATNIIPNVKSDKEISNEIIKFLELPHPQLVGKRHQEDWISWLEKQGQKDPCEDCKHPMLNCHNFPCSKKQKYQGKSALEAAKEEKVDNSNKVKPKFHEGDFIRHNKSNIIYKVISVNSSFYYIENIKTSVRIGLFNVEQNFHLWTIADAKDGDVLDANSAPFIYKKHDKDYVYFYCGVNLADEFVEANGIDIWNNNNKVYPATKEQRELLFSKMKEAGYEWDSEKKELRKIEQKLAEKVEPRFKVGDFIVNNNDGDIYQVTEIRDDEYCLWPLYAEIMGYLRINDVDNEYHLWSIKDAKDGNVLVYNNIATEIIMLFRCKAINKPRAYTHFHIFDNDFRVNGCCACGNDACPATKEQRDHLFKKIKEVGYKWDSNTKELKKIETINIPFNAKDSELIEATYFIPEGFHAEIVDNKVIIKKSDQPQNLETN